MLNLQIHKRMHFIVTYILSFFICHFVGNIFYMKSDKGIFSMVGFLPIINSIVSFLLIMYLVYVLVDMFIIDRFKEPRKKNWRYNRLFDITTD